MIKNLYYHFSESQPRGHWIPLFTVFELHDYFFKKIQLAGLSEEHSLEILQLTNFRYFLARHFLVWFCSFGIKFINNR